MPQIDLNLFFILFWILFANACALKAHSIQIDSANSNITIDTGDNFTLICLSHSAPSWNYRNPNNMLRPYRNWTQIVINTKSIDDGPYKFNSTLSVINATYSFTNYYTCNYSASQSETLNSTSIYIYVRSDTQLEAHDEYIGILQASLHESIFIPCRPTNPNIDVNLFNNDEQEENNLVYDPRDGYLIDDVTYNFVGFWTCTYTYKGTTQETYYPLIIV